MADTKYLDENGLLYFWQKLKPMINSKTTMSEVEAKGYTTMSAVEAKNYTTMNAVEGKGYTTMSAVEGKGYQTSDQVSSAITTAIGGISQFKLQKVTSLPTTGVTGTIYLVAKTTAGTDDVYNEYYWVAEDSKYEFMGTTQFSIEAIPNTDIDTILTK